MRTLKLCLFTVGLLPALGCTSLRSAPTETISLAPARDTTLIETAPDRNNGSQEGVNAGTSQNGTRNRGLFQWDFVGVVPAGVTILSVELILDVTRVPGCGNANSSFSLYRMLRPWGEGNKIALDNPGGQGAPATAGEATWNEAFFGSTPWTAPGSLAGVDFVSSPSASENIYDIGRSPYTFVSGSELIADVQAWVDNPQSNFGWILLSDDEGTAFTARRFGSREDPDHHPVLTVQFEVVPEPGSLLLIGIGLAVFAVALRRRGFRGQGAKRPEALKP